MDTFYEARKIIPREWLEFLRYSAISGFIALSVLVINLSNKAFAKVFKENATKLWWLFVLLSLIPVLGIIYIFSRIFGKV